MSVTLTPSLTLALALALTLTLTLTTLTLTSLQAAEGHTGGIDDRSGGSSTRAAASTADAAHEIFARAAAASEVYTRVSKPLKPF